MIEIDSAFSYKDVLNVVKNSLQKQDDEFIYEFTVDDGIVARKLKITQFTLMKLLDWAYLLN